MQTNSEFDRFVNHTIARALSLPADRLPHNFVDLLRNKERAYSGSRRDSERMREMRRQWGGEIISGVTEPTPT